jgi:hypothetical protein
MFSKSTSFESPWILLDFAIDCFDWGGGGGSWGNLEELMNNLRPKH